jgi:hypothetical protein
MENLYVPATAVNTTKAAETLGKNFWYSGPETPTGFPIWHSESIPGHARAHLPGLFYNSFPEFVLRNPYTVPMEDLCKPATAHSPGFPLRH